MTGLERKALLGDRWAQKKCTERGIALPCPCCKGKAVFGSDSDYDCYLFWGTLYCENCGLRINGDPTAYEENTIVTKEMLAKWNTRPKLLKLLEVQ